MATGETAAEGGAKTEEAVAEARVLKDGAEGEPIFGAEIGTLEEVVFLGSEKILAPGSEKVAREVRAKALEVPVVVAEFGGVHSGAELRKKAAFAEESLDFGVFFDDAVNLVGAIDGGGRIVNAVVVKSVGEEDDGFRGSPDFEAKAKVLVRGAGSGEEADVVIEEELAAIDSGPDSRGELEEERMFWAAKRAIREVGGVFGGGGEDFLDGLAAGFSGAEFVIVGLDDVGVEFLRSSIEALESARLSPIVRLDDADVFAFGLAKGEVHAVAVAGVFLVDNDDTGVALSEAMNDVERVVS